MQYLYIRLYFLYVSKQTLMSVKSQPITVPWKTLPQQTASTHTVDSFAHVYDTWDIDCVTLLDVKVIPTFTSKVKNFLLLCVYSLNSRY